MIGGKSGNMETGREEQKKGKGRIKEKEEAFKREGNNENKTEGERGVKNNSRR